MLYNFKDILASPEPFTKTQLSVAEDLLNASLSLDLRQRPEYSQFTVDPNNTRVRDDAFGNLNNSFVVSIADPSIIPGAHDVALDALARGADFFGAEGRIISMLPPLLLEKLLSLNSDGNPKATISALIDPTNRKITNSPLEASSSRIVDAMSYEQAQKLARNPQSEFFSVAERLKLLSQMVSVGGNLLDPLQKKESRYTLQQGVHICNALFNLVATDFALRNEVPVLFPHLRRKHGESIDLENEPEALRSLNAMKLIREYSNKPSKEVYVGNPDRAPFSRPLRDPAAFVNISNLSAFLRGETLPYPADVIEVLAPYLTEAEAKREAALKASASMRVERLFGQPDAELTSCSKREFARMLLHAIETENLPPHLQSELLRRMDAGLVNLPDEMTMIAAGPRQNDPQWYEARKRVLVWMKENNRALKLLYRANKMFPAWQESRIDLREYDNVYEAWGHITVNNVNYSSATGRSCESANVVTRRAALDIWKGYFSGTLKEGIEKPTIFHQVEYHSPIAKEFELPLTPDEPLNKHQATMLHITCSVLGLNPPLFDKRAKIRNTKDGLQIEFRTSIYGLSLIDPVKGVMSTKSSETSTNLTAGIVMYNVRTQLGVERITQEQIEQTRKSKWSRRSVINGNVSIQNFWPTPKPRHQAGVFEDLTQICRAHGWADPLILKEGKKRALAMKVGEVLIDSPYVPEKDFDKAQSASEFLGGLKNLFGPSMEYNQCLKDIDDSSTAIGLLRIIARDKFNSELQIEFNHIDRTQSTKISIPGGPALKELPSSHKTLRESLAESSLRFLTELREEGETALNVNNPIPVKENSIIPVQYLLSIDTIYELSLLCHEQGFSQPVYQIEMAEKGGSGTTTCQIKSPEGIVFNSIINGINPIIRERAATAFALAMLRPAYRGDPIFIRKLSLLTEQHGWPAPEITLEKSEDKKSTVCTIKGSYFGFDIEVKSSGDTAKRAQDRASANFLRRVEYRFKRGQWETRHSA